MALRLGDPALLLQDPPGHVELLGADQAEDVLLAAVLADQGGRQAEPAAGLDLGRDPEDRRGQQVHLVVDDQAPVALVEQREVGEVAVLLGPVGHDLVGGQGHRRDRPSSRRCRSRPGRRRGRSCRGSRAPLLDGGGAGGQDQRALLQERHGRDADDRLARAAGQHDHARAAPDVAAGVERVDGHPLVVADLERQARAGRPRGARPRAPARRCSRPGPRPGSRRRSRPASGRRGTRRRWRSSSRRSGRPGSRGPLLPRQLLEQRRRPG